MSHELFDLLDAAYIDHLSFQKLYWRSDGQKDPAFVDSLVDNGLSVIDFSTEHWGPGKYRLFDEVYDTLESRGCRFIMLSHRPEDHLRRPHLFFCPVEYHRSQKNFLYADDWNKAPKTYKVSCLNHMSRPHRIYNWYKIKDKGYFRDCLWSMHQTTLQRSDEPELPEDAAKAWDIARKHFPESGQTLQDYKKDYIWSLDHPAYTDSYINIITEHSVIDGIYLSEKTWKPVASGQLFLCVGNPGTIEYLRSVGVDVFDDVIDHSYYDRIEDWKIRIDRIHEILDDLVNKDLTMIYQNLQRRRQNNIENFRAGKFDTDFRSTIQKEIFSRLGRQ